MHSDDRDKKLDQVYRAGRLSILELMTVLAVLGVLLTWVLQRFFLS